MHDEAVHLFAYVIIRHIYAYPQIPGVLTWGIICNRMFLGAGHQVACRVTTLGHGLITFDVL